MKKLSILIILIALLIIFGTLFAKAQQAITTGGNNTITFNTYALRSTIGETFISTNNTANKISISVGYQQSLNQLKTSVNEVKNIEVKTWPNPTINSLNIQLSEVKQYTYFIYDLQGRMIGSETFNNQNYTINVAVLSEGSYMLVLQENKKMIKQVLFNKLKE